MYIIHEKKNNKPPLVHYCASKESNTSSATSASRTADFYTCFTSVYFVSLYAEKNSLAHLNEINVGGIIFQKPPRA